MTSVNPTNGDGAEVINLPCSDDSVNVTEALLMLSSRIHNVEKKIDKIDTNITIIMDCLKKHLLKDNMEGK
jgi:thymidylate kinase